MKSRKSKDYLKMAAVLILSLLMASLPALAGDDVGQISTKEIMARWEGESPSGSGAESAQTESDDFWSISNSSTRELLAQSEGESASGSEAGGSGKIEMDASKVGKKELSQQSANPVGRFAYIFTQVAMSMNDGDLNTGDHHYSGNITFQPIIPIPLYGSGIDEWRIVTRPTINLSIDQPIPDSGRQDDFDRTTAISDLLVPLPVALPDRIAGRALIALGPSFSFPTASDDEFGKEQWCAGVSGVFGYIAENWMFGIYPQTYFRIADEGRDDADRAARYGNMFYWFFYNITDDTQIGFSPTIQWNDKAGSGNKWNVPFGPALAKVTKWGNTMIRIELGAEISVVREDDYGEVGRIKCNLIPVVGRPIKSAIFGGGKKE